MPQRPDTAFLLYYERPFEVGRLVAEAYDVTNPREPRGWTMMKFDRKTWLSGLQVTGYIDAEHTEVWGWDFSYYSGGHVELRQAEVMVTILREIDRGLRKETGQSGYAQTYFEYLTSIARTLGIRRFLIRHDQRQRAETGEWFRVATAEDVRLWIVAQEAIYCKKPELTDA